MATKLLKQTGKVPQRAHLDAFQSTTIFLPDPQFSIRACRQKDGQTGYFDPAWNLPVDSVNLLPHHPLPILTYLSSVCIIVFDI